MIAGLIVLLVVALVAVNWLYIRHLERKDARHAEQVAGLLVHVQAPETAVAQAVAVSAHDRPAVNPFDEQDYWAARDEALQRMSELERELG